MALSYCLTSQIVPSSLPSIPCDFPWIFSYLNAIYIPSFKLSSCRLKLGIERCKGNSKASPASNWISSCQVAVDMIVFSLIPVSSLRLEDTYILNVVLHSVYIIFYIVFSTHFGWLQNICATRAMHGAFGVPSSSSFAACRSHRHGRLQAQS